MCAVWCISPDHISYLAWQACQYLNDALTTQDKLPTQREVETLFESLLRLSQPPSQLYFALFFFPLLSCLFYSPLYLSLFPRNYKPIRIQLVARDFIFGLSLGMQLAPPPSLEGDTKIYIIYTIYLYYIYYMYVHVELQLYASNNYQK